MFYQVIGPIYCSAEKNRSTSWRTMLSTVNDILPILVPKLDISRANWAIFSLRLQIVIQGKELLGHFNRMSVCPVLTAVQVIPTTTAPTIAISTTTLSIQTPQPSLVSLLIGTQDEINAQKQDESITHSLFGQ